MATAIKAKIVLRNMSCLVCIVAPAANSIDWRAKRCIGEKRNPPAHADGSDLLINPGLRHRIGRQQTVAPSICARGAAAATFASHRWRMSRRGGGGH